MKARIRKTGEIVDIVCYTGTTSRATGDTVSYIDSNGVEHYRENLNYFIDFEEVGEDEVGKDEDKEIINEDNLEKQEIKITETLADELDGRCFMDLDMSDRIEGIKFIKTDRGIDALCIGCNYHWRYVLCFHDNYGTYRIEDTYNGTNIALIKEKSPFLVEISLEIFDKMNEIVNDKIDENKKMEKDFKKKQRELKETILGHRTDIRHKSI